MCVSVVASGGCAGVDQVFLGRVVDEVIDDSVHHGGLTLLTAILKIFPSQILDH